MNKTFKTILAVVMAVAMMASLCVTAMADYPAAFNYVPGNKPTDIWITDGQSRVELKKAQEWPDDLSLVDTYAIAENVAYTLFVNGQNYQPIIDVNDVYHFVVFSPICFAVPMCWEDGVSVNMAEFTIVAFGFPDGSVVDYQILDPFGNPVTGGQCVVNDNIGHVVLPESMMAGLADGVYSFVINGKLPGEGDGDGKDYTSTSPFGVKDGKLVSALDEDLGNGKKKNNNNYGPHDTGDPVGPAPVPKKVERNIGHGFTVSAGDNLNLGSHFNLGDRTVTVTVGGMDMTFPTSKLTGDFHIGPTGDHNPGLTLDFPLQLPGNDNSYTIDFSGLFNGWKK